MDSYRNGPRLDGCVIESASPGSSLASVSQGIQEGVARLEGARSALSLARSRLRGHLRGEGPAATQPGGSPSIPQAADMSQAVGLLHTIISAIESETKSIHELLG